MNPIIVIRPEPGCSATLEGLRAAGHEAHGFPLQEAGPVAWTPPDPADFDAILSGSANAFRHGGEGLHLFRHLPVHAVGRATAQAAQAAGFAVERVGEGGLQALLVNRDGGAIRYLRLAGRDHVALDIPQGIAITTCIIYEMNDRPMPEAMVNLLAGPAIVLLHSAASAQHFSAECGRLGVHRGAIVIGALGPRISKAAGGGWRSVHNAGRPTDAALLAIIGDMCH